MLTVNHIFMPSSLYNTRQDLAQQGKTTDNITHRRHFQNIICVRSEKQALNKRDFIDTFCGNRGLNTLRPRQDGRHFSDDVLSNAFSWMKMYEFRLRFDWILFLGFQLTIFQQWLRFWLGAVQATSHYLNQWWLVYWRIYASLGLNESKE